MYESLEPIGRAAKVSEDDEHYRADRKALLGCLMQAFEGPAGLAKTCKLEFDAAQAGSTVRTKVLTTIFDLMKDVGDEDEEFDDEDYEAVARMQQQSNGTA